MELTRYDYLIYCNVSIFDIENEIRLIGNQFWPNSFMEIVEQTPNNMWLIFSESEETLRNEDLGYELNEKGEGCFSIIGSRVGNLDEILASYDDDRKISGEIRIIIQNVWMYTVVLPEVLEKSEFSLKVYNALRKILGGARGDSMADILTPQPVQSFI